MRSYEKQIYALDREMRAKMRTYLSGLFTSKYGDEFMLHYVCPLCGEQITNIKKINMRASEIKIDFQHEVTGRMTNELRQQLAHHYLNDCGSDRERRETSAEILFDKFQDGVYS